MLTDLQKHVLILDEPVPNFLKALNIKYEDFKLNREQKSALNTNMDNFHKNMEKLVKEYRTDHLSTELSVHLTDTIGQSKEDLSEWLIKKQFIVGASGIKTFSKNPKEFIQHFWRMTPDISKCKQIVYGNISEPKAYLRRKWQSEDAIT